MFLGVLCVNLSQSNVFNECRMLNVERWFSAAAAVAPPIVPPIVPATAAAGKITSLAPYSIVPL